MNKGDRLDMANYMQREFACYQRMYNFNKQQKHHTGHQCIEMIHQDIGFAVLPENSKHFAH
ncbi:hypothetical protein T11_9013 [Trichinella zimbabwensis]|uniref:Uncharacterized protein n=1 Tax=Trichinella zimbabwensis TaxID=268475 RepID=A0A0V1H405_9BILA|nr:hypothetical protein T11_9013 [Trichinella zimbabwensis]